MWLFNEAISRASTTSWLLVPQTPGSTQNPQLISPPIRLVIRSADCAPRRISHEIQPLTSHAVCLSIYPLRWDVSRNQTVLQGSNYKVASRLSSSDVCGSHGANTCAQQSLLQAYPYVTSHFHSCSPEITLVCAANHIVLVSQRNSPGSRFATLRRRSSTPGRPSLS